MTDKTIQDEIKELQVMANRIEDLGEKAKLNKRISALQRKINF